MSTQRLLISGTLLLTLGCHTKQNLWKKSIDIIDTVLHVYNFVLC